MASVKSFEELPVWQLAHELSKEIYAVTLLETFSKDFSLKDQVNRAAESIMDNIAEGFERGGNREFIHFLSMAKGSSGEVRSQLYRAIDRGHISHQQFKELSERIVSISKQISGLIQYLKTSELKGSKFVREPEQEYEVDFES